MAGYLVNFSSLSLIASLDKIPSWGKKQIGEDCQPPPPFIHVEHNMFIVYK